MRKVTFGCAASLDNFIAREDGGVDWLKFSSDAAKIMNEYWPKVDCILMGRKTWDAAQAMGGGEEFSDDGTIKTYVFSRTLKTIERPGVELVSSDVADFVRQLKQKDGKEICMMGGGELAVPLFEAGLIDEVGVNAHPVLLGSGVPMFHPMRTEVRLELVESRKIKHGCVYLHYKVAR